MSYVLLVLLNGADLRQIVIRRPHHLCHLKCNKSLIHKHFVFDVTWSVEQIAQQNRGTICAMP